MAAKDPEKGRAHYDLLFEMLQEAVDDGVITAGGTVTTALSNIATERDAH